MRLNRIIGIGLISLISLVSVSFGAESKPRPLRSYFPAAWGDRLNIQIELRHRFEYRDNFDFNDLLDDQDGFQLFRSRLNLGIQPIRGLRLFLQLQDARIWETENFRTPAFQDTVDIRQAYLEIQIRKHQWILRVGRQQLTFGNERVIGGFNWSNVAQSFDGIKLGYRQRKFDVDAFIARKVKIQSGLNEWDSDDTLYGLFVRYKGLKSAVVEGYVVYRNTDRPISFGPQLTPGDLAETTIGIWINRTPGKGLDYTLEAAFQLGSFGRDDIRAYAWALRVGYTFDVPWKPRLGFEWDYASGDDDPTDGTRKTFDNLFPTNHLHYGYMDRLSWQNLNNLRFMLALVPMTRLKIAFDVHRARVAETADALFNAGRKPYRLAVVPGVSGDVGTEIDVTARVRLNPLLGILVGYSHFYAGDYLRATGAADDGEFFYVQTLFRW